LSDVRPLQSGSICERLLREAEFTLSYCEYDLQTLDEALWQADVQRPSLK